MTLRGLLWTLIALLVANLALALWNNRMDPTEASPEEYASAPAAPCYLPHYDDPAALLAPPYLNPVEPAPLEALQEDFSDRREDAGPFFVDALPEALQEGLADENTGEILTIVRIVDGDTFELSDGTRVRLIGIDAPEMHPSGKLSRDAERTGMDRKEIQALGRRATEHASTLALGRPVELEYGAGPETDFYDRTLAYVWVLDEQGRRLYRVNDFMVIDGYAETYSRAPFEYMEEYQEYERQARLEERGLWED